MPSFDGGDNFVWIGDPFEGFGMGVVIVEEAIDRGLEVGDGSEDSAFEAAFGEGCEETLNGVEPGGRGRREVEGPSRIARQPLAHDRMLVSSVIVEDGVDGLARGDLALNGVEKANELLVSMTLHVAADHGSIEDVHGRKQGGRAVPLVVMGHRSGAALFHRQPWLGAVERLDLALFVDAEDDCVRRWIDIEADHVAQLADEFGVLGKLELANAMGLQPMGAPDALDRTDADAGRLGHGNARPVRGLARRRCKGQSDDALGDRGVELGDARGTRLVAQKALEALAGEAFLPAPDAGLGLAGVAHDRARADAFGRQQHDLCAPDVLLRRVAVFDESSEPSPIGKCDRKGNAGSHPPDSHAASPRGILNRIQTSDLIH
jgi:hypothetical protein